MDKFNFILLVFTRSAWRPHFLFDETATVNIPSLRFFTPKFEQHIRELSVLSRIEKWGSEAASCCADEVTTEDYDALSKNKKRVAAFGRLFSKPILPQRPTTRWSGHLAII